LNFGGATALLMPHAHALIGHGSRFHGVLFA
jgi:hypothetical protein